MSGGRVVRTSLRIPPLLTLLFTAKSSHVVIRRAGCRHKKNELSGRIIVIKKNGSKSKNLAEYSRFCGGKNAVLRVLSNS